MSIYFQHNVDHFRADWGSFMRSKKLAQPVHFQNWLLLADDNSMRDVHNFLNTLKRVARVMGIEVEDPRVLVLQE